MAYIKATNLRCAFALDCSVWALGFTECGVIRIDAEINSMRHIMKYRYPRIAWSATCLTVSVLLIGLWVRSYWQDDVICYSTSPIALASSHFADTCCLFSSTVVIIIMPGSG